MEENLSGTMCLLVLTMGAVIVLLLALLIKLLDSMGSQPVPVVMMSSLPAQTAGGSGCAALLSLLILLAGTMVLLGMLAH